MTVVVAVQVVAVLFVADPTCRRFVCRRSDLSPFWPVSHKTHLKIEAGFLGANLILGVWMGFKYKYICEHWLAYFNADIIFLHESYRCQFLYNKWENGIYILGIQYQLNELLYVNQH